ncbi:Zonadhesin [Frankliniella fusca]|uniref:Zonadhesin n=1 Tax=Frankliniella fusca TaxID=407009 RepID=A0AAE1LRZ0_9NEOP|nr:Zonadhesin [Frankliniella fusca]
MRPVPSSLLLSARAAGRDAKLSPRTGSYGPTALLLKFACLLLTDAHEFRFLRACFVLALVLLLLAVAAWGKEPTATRGRPVAKMPNNTMLADVSVEQPDGLNAGCIFTQRGDLYFSVSDWLLVLKVQRVDTYMTVVDALINKFAALHDQYVESTSTLHNTVIRDEIGGMLMELTQIKRDLSVFRAYVNNTELPDATVNATVTPPVAVGNATQTNTTAAPSRSKRQVPIPAGIVSNCSMTDPANLCHPANVFLPLWVPSASSPKAADLSHYLSVFYRRISRRIRRDVELNQQRYSPMSLPNILLRPLKHKYISPTRPPVWPHTAAVLSALSANQSSTSTTTPKPSTTTPPTTTHMVPTTTVPIMSTTTQPQSSTTPLPPSRRPAIHSPVSRPAVISARPTSTTTTRPSRPASPPTTPKMFSPAPPLTSTTSSTTTTTTSTTTSPRPPSTSTTSTTTSSPSLPPPTATAATSTTTARLAVFSTSTTTPSPRPRRPPPLVAVAPSRVPSSVAPVLASSIPAFTPPSPADIQAYKHLRDQLAKAAKAPLPTTVVPPTVRTVVDDLPDGDTERRLLKEFRDWKMGLSLSSTSPPTTSTTAPTPIPSTDPSQTTLRPRSISPDLSSFQLVLPSKSPRPASPFSDPFARPKPTTPRPRKHWDLFGRAVGEATADPALSIPVLSPVGENPTSDSAFPDLPDTFAFPTGQSANGPRPEDFPDFPDSTHPLDTPISSLPDHTLASLPYGLFLPADFLRDINLTAIPQPVPHHRSRRGVFKSWFGIMDSADRENLQSRFDEMKLKIDGLRVLQDAQTGLANVTLARFLAQDRMIEALKQLEKESFQITIDQQNQYMEYALKMRRMHALIAQVRSEVKTFLTAFHFAELNNMLSPAFVDAEAFSKLLTQLSEQLPPGIQLPVLPTPDRIDYYFRVARASAVVTTDAMHLHVHLPLVFTTRKYKLYEITPFPRKLNNSDIYSFYSTDTKYIAVDEPQKTHVLLTDADLRSCHDHPETPICSPAVPVHEEEDTCAIALLLSDKAKIDTLCEPYLHFVKNPPPTFVSYRAGHTWAFSVPEKTKLVLTDTQGRHLQSNVTMLPQTGILHLPAFTIAKALGVALYSGSTFVSHEDLSGSLILPDIPSVELPQLALNNTNRHIIIEQLDDLFNKSAQLGLDGALRLQEIKAALEPPWFRDWHTHALAYSDLLPASVRVIPRRDSTKVTSTPLTTSSPVCGRHFSTSDFRSHAQVTLSNGSVVLTNLALPELSKSAVPSNFGETATYQLPSSPAPRSFSRRLSSLAPLPNRPLAPRLANSATPPAPFKVPPVPSASKPRTRPSPAGPVGVPMASTASPLVDMRAAPAGAGPGGAGASPVRAMASSPRTPLAASSPNSPNLQCMSSPVTPSFSPMDISASPQAIEMPTANRSRSMSFGTLVHWYLWVDLRTGGHRFVP